MTASKIVMNAASGVGGGLNEPVVTVLTPNIDTSGIPDLYPYAIADSEGNIYYTINKSNTAGKVGKIDADGAEVWQREFQYIEYFSKIMLSSDETRVFYAGETQVGRIGGTNDVVLIEVAASDGSYTKGVQFAEGAGGTHGTWTVAACINPSNDEITISHQQEDDATAAYMLTTIDTSGASFTFNNIDRSSIVSAPIDLVFYNNYFYAPHQSYNGNLEIYANRHYYTSFSTSSRNLRSSAGNMSVAPSSGSNILPKGSLRGALQPTSAGSFMLARTSTSNGFYLLKGNSTFSSITFAKDFEHSDLTVFSDIEPIGMTSDSSSNLYIMSVGDDNDSPNIIFIHKIDSSGSVVWQRTIQTQKDYDPDWGSITMAPDDASLVVCFPLGRNLLVGRFPLDGSGVGLYKDFLYGDENMGYGSAFTVTDVTSDITNTNTSTSMYADGYTSKSWVGPVAGDVFIPSTEYDVRTSPKADMSGTSIEVVGVFGKGYSGDATAHRFPNIPDNLQDDDVIVGMVAGADYTGVSVVTNIVEAGFVDVKSAAANDTYDTWMDLEYGILSGSYDHVEIQESKDTQNAQFLSGIVLRGVDTTTPIDVAAIAQSQTNYPFVTPGSITPVTDGAVIIVHIASGSGAYSAHDEYQDGNDDYLFFTGEVKTDTADIITATGIAVWNTGDGAFAPSEIDGSFPSGGITVSSAAITSAWRPAS